MVKSYDVLIIGSGINSLAAGAFLARKGKQVGIFEKNAWLGGNIKTDEQLFPGFKIDVFSGFHPLFVSGPVYEELKDELEANGLRYRNTTLPTAVLLPDGRSAVFSTDRAETVAELNRIHPGDGDRYAVVMDEFNDLYAKLTFGLLSNDVAGFDLAKLSAQALFSLGTGAVEFFGRALAPARTFLDNNFRGDLTKALLAPWVLHNGQGPDDASSALIVQVIFSTLETVGMPVPEGGGSRLVDALVAIIRQNGGELFTNAPVEQINTEGNRVTGVRVGGTTYNADTIVANVTPTQLYGQLIPDEAVSSEVRRQTREYRYGRGNMQINLTLSAPPNWPDERLRQVAIVHLTPGLDGVSQAVNEATRGLLPQHATIVVGQHMALDPTRGPAGQWTIWIQLQEMPTHLKGDAAGLIDTSAGWTDAVKEAYADRIVAQIDAVCPGFRASVTHRHVISPAELGAINPNLVGGDPYSGACTIDQFLLWRPFKSRLPHQTPFANLYHIGASTHPGPGLSGTSGYLVAKKIG